MGPFIKTERNQSSEQVCLQLTLQHFSYIMRAGIKLGRVQGLEDNPVIKNLIGISKQFVLNGN